MNSTGSWLAENGSKLALVIGSRIVSVLGFQQSSENCSIRTNYMFKLRRRNSAQFATLILGGCIKFHKYMALLIKFVTLKTNVNCIAYNTTQINTIQHNSPNLWSVN